MPADHTICFKVDDELYDALQKLSAKKHLSMSELIRKLIQKSLDSELADEQVDFVRSQIAAELRENIKPQFDRIAKLEAKIGYQSIATFHLLAYLIENIFPQNDFENIKSKSKQMALAYLKPSETQIADIMKSDERMKEKAEK